MSHERFVCLCKKISVEEAQKATNIEDLKKKHLLPDESCQGACLGLLSNLANNSASNDSLEHIALLNGVSLFNRKFYWEAHETLEDAWLDLTGTTKVFYQGIIQAAAACYHVVNQNPAGVERLSRLALEKLASFPDPYLGIHYGATSAALESYRQLCEEGISHFDLKSLPKLSVED